MKTIQINTIKEVTESEYNDLTLKFNTINVVGEYTKEQSIAITKLVELLESNIGIAVELCFNKKPTQEDILEKLQELYANKKGFMSKADFTIKARHIASTLILGAERTMKCYLTGSILLGRLQVKDIEDNNSYKQVDSRTIKWCILNGIKYVVK